MLARIRKAITAGLAAALAAFLPALLDQLNITGFAQVSVVRSVGLALTAGILAGLATYKVRNVPAPADR